MPEALQTSGDGMCFVQEHQRINSQQHQVRHSRILDFRWGFTNTVRLPQFIILRAFSQVLILGILILDLGFFPSFFVQCSHHLLHENERVCDGFVNIFDGTSSDENTDGPTCQSATYLISVFLISTTHPSMRSLFPVHHTLNLLIQKFPNHRLLIRSLTLSNLRSYVLPSSTLLVLIFQYAILILHIRHVTQRFPEVLIRQSFKSQATDQTHISCLQLLDQPISLI